MHEQVRKTAEAALEAIEGGMCVVIGLQSTGEANTSASREEQGDVLDDFVSGGCLIRAAANCSGHPIAMSASDATRQELCCFSVTPLVQTGNLLKESTHHPSKPGKENSAHCLLPLHPFVWQSFCLSYQDVPVSWALP